MIDRVRRCLPLLCLLGLAGCPGDNGPKHDTSGKLPDAYHPVDQVRGLEPGKKADGAGGDAKVGDGSKIGDAATGSCKPYCYPPGSKSQGWYDGCTKKILMLPGTNQPYNDACDGCTVECRTSPAKGWYSSCTSQLIIMGCN
jgi:hypothetical protein